MIQDYLEAAALRPNNLTVSDTVVLLTDRIGSASALVAHFFSPNVSCPNPRKVASARARLFVALPELLEAFEAQNAFIVHIAGEIPEQGMGCQNFTCPDGCHEGKTLLEAARDAYQCALAKLNNTPQETT